MSTKIRIPKRDPNDPEQQRREKVLSEFLESVKKDNPEMSLDEALKELGDIPRPGPWPAQADPRFSKGLATPGRVFQDVTSDKAANIIGDIMQDLPESHSTLVIYLTAKDVVDELDIQFDLTVYRSVYDVPAAWAQSYHDLRDDLIGHVAQLVRQHDEMPTVQLVAHSRGVFWRETDPKRYELTGTDEDGTIIE